MAGTSVNTIAATAGLRSSSVFFHYPTKDALVDAMLAEGIRAALAYLDDALPGADDPDARLRAAIRAHANAVYDIPHHTRAVLDPALTGGPEFRELRGEYVRRWTGLITDAQNAGVLGAGADPRLVRDLVLGALNAVGLTRRSPAKTTAAMEVLLGLDIPRE